MAQAAIYLLNRTPRHKLGWRSPHEAFYTWLRDNAPATGGGPSPAGGQVRPFTAQWEGLTFTGWTALYVQEEGLGRARNLVLFSSSIDPETLFLLASICYWSRSSSQSSGYLVFGLRGDIFLQTWGLFKASQSLRLQGIPNYKGSATRKVFKERMSATYEMVTLRSNAAILSLGSVKPCRISCSILPKRSVRFCISCSILSKRSIRLCRRLMERLQTLMERFGRMEQEM